MKIIEIDKEVIIDIGSFEAALIEANFQIVIILKSGQLIRPREWRYTSFEGAQSKLNKLYEILTKD